MGCKLFLDAKTSLFGSQVILIRIETIEPGFGTLLPDGFLLCRFRLSLLTMHSKRNLLNFLNSTEGRDFCIWGKLFGKPGELRDSTCLSSKQPKWVLNVLK